jgi:hypothetical protein
VLPFPYFGQTLPELLRNCRRQARKPVPAAIRPISHHFNERLINSNSKYTYPSSGSYAAWLTLNSNTASDSWPSPPLMSVSPTPTKRRKHYERHND